MSNKSIIESLLYVSGNDGIDTADIKKVIGITADEIRDIVKSLKKMYDENPDCGWTIKIYGSHFYLLTKPENKEFIAKLLDVRVKNPLSPAAMETLAIVAYNNPCTSTLIEEKRTTNSDAAVVKLEKLGLIANIGRATTPGRPYLYEVTQKFFNLFGIKSLSDLPPLAEQNEDTDLSFFDANRDVE